MNAERPWYTYLVECADGLLYCGVTVDVERRLAEHNAGTASRCTRPRRPVRLLAVSRPLSKQEAMRLEWRVKKLPRERKLPVFRCWSEDSG